MSKLHNLNSAPAKVIAAIMLFMVLLPGRSLSQVEPINGDDKAAKRLRKSLMLVGADRVYGAKKMEFRTVDAIDARGRAFSMQMPKVPTRQGRAEILIGSQNYVSLGQALKAAKAGDVIKISPGSTSLPRIVVNPYMPEETYGITFAAGVGNSISYTEVVASKSGPHVFRVPWQNLQIVGVGEPTPFPLDQWLELPQAKSARGAFHKWVDSNMPGAEKGTLAVPTIKAASQSGTGFEFDRENFDLGKKQSPPGFPTPQSTISFTHLVSLNPDSAGNRTVPLLIQNGSNVTFSNVTFLGAARGHMSTLLGPDDPTPAQVEIVNSEGIHFSNCAFVNSTGIGVLVVNSRDITFDNCVFAGSIANAIQIIDSGVTIRASKFLGNGRGWRWNAATSADTKMQPPAPGILAFDSFLAVENSLFKATGASSISLSRCSSVYAKGNVFDEDYSINLENCGHGGTQLVENLARARLLSGEPKFPIWNLSRQMKRADASNPPACTELVEFGGNQVGIDKNAALSTLARFATDKDPTARQSAFELHSKALAECHGELSSIGLLGKFLSCSFQYYAGTKISDPFEAAAICEVIDSQIEARPIDSGELAVGTVENILADELRNRGYDMAAFGVEVASFARCLID